eukprot:CAMPEP_0114117546 /NCGR_PEP_ID=MMETSP0043_2-20121206/5092_1 /TAXON_ID=464988 /ORGANISM="Hemiselmis andersenii, Strain CCMP644" /LENGTH=117 /DNA_ID=CAMNT_0001209947 /DNA_START=224 /DNA_END=578 /DNA_ORIENTATION=-
MGPAALANPGHAVKGSTAFPRARAQLRACPPVQAGYCAIAASLRVTRLMYLSSVLVFRHVELHVELVPFNFNFGGLGSASDPLAAWQQVAPQCRCRVRRQPGPRGTGALRLSTSMEV